MVELKNTEKAFVAVKSGKGLDDFDNDEAELKSALSRDNVEPDGPTIGIFYDNPDEVGRENVHYEVCIPVQENTEVEGVETKRLGRAKAASIIHKGSFDELGKSFEEIFKWIDENKHKVNGPVREIYLDSSTTEIQIPVE